MIESTPIHLSSDVEAWAVFPENNTSIDEIRAALRVPMPRAVLTINGGTATIAPDLQERLSDAITDGVAMIASTEEILLVTGGSDAGVFHLLGEGLALYGRTAPCIGVAVRQLSRTSSTPNHYDWLQQAPLEPHHSHFVLVPGRDWGDETATMYRLVQSLSQDVPSLTVFAGGGEITTHEMQANVELGRKMILLAGSGRATDQVLAALRGEPVADSRHAQIAKDGHIIPFHISNSPQALAQLIRTELNLS